VAQRLLLSVAARKFLGSSPSPRFFSMVEIVKKINSEMFELIRSGKKNFEVRIEDDCRFNEGDVLILRECGDKKELTGRELRKVITFVLRTRECSFWTKEEINKYGFTVLSLK
jgi:hypothetical protein